MQNRDRYTFLKVNIMTPENQSRGARGDIQCQAVAGNGIFYAFHGPETENTAVGIPGTTRVSEK
jgi:hypothetical protein